MIKSGSSEMNFWNKLFKSILFMQFWTTTSYTTLQHTMMPLNLQDHLRDPDKITQFLQDCETYLLMVLMN